MDTKITRTYTVCVEDERIRVLDRVSWKSSSDVRLFGHVHRISAGFYIVISDNGVRFALYRSRLTKECP